MTAIPRRGHVSARPSTAPTSRPSSGPHASLRGSGGPAAPLGRAPAASAAVSVRTTKTVRLPDALAPAGVRSQPTGRVVKGPERERHEPDYLLLVSVVALAATGILMIYSSSAARIARDPVGGDPFGAILTELMWVSLGVAAMVLMARLDYRWLRLASIPAYLGAAALLFIVLLPATGPFVPIESGGAARWLKIGPLPQMHPAEVAKLALIIYLAHWLARRGTTVGSVTRGLLPFLLIAGPIIGLIALEPDLGTTGVVTLAAFTMFFVAGGSILQLAALAPLGLVVLVAYVLTNSYQLVRWQTFLDPFMRPLAEGFHTVQGLYALALGGIFGNGLGETRGPGGLYLPNADNDYVFAMVGQEFGLVGGLTVIGLFLFFAYRGLRIARYATDTFGALLAVGITAWIALQAFINIGVVVNLLPVTGITLPFVSSGGTSLVVSFTAVGILLSISRETLSRGTIDDADPDRGRRHRWPHLPGARRAAQPRSPGR